LVLPDAAFLFARVAMELHAEGDALKWTEPPSEADQRRLAKLKVVHWRPALFHRSLDAEYRPD